MALFIVLFLGVFINTNANSSVGINSSKFSDIKTKQYKVRRGDNLWMIAKRNKPSRNVATARMLEAIQYINKESLENSSALHAGMKLLLPLTASGVYKILHKDEMIINNKSSKTKVEVNAKSNIKSNIKFNKKTNDILVNSDINNSDINKTQNNIKAAKVLEIPKSKYNIKKTKKTQNKKNTQKTDSSNAWVLLTVFFMFTSMFLYWRMRKLSEGRSKPQGSAARRLGVRSRDNNSLNNSVHHMQVSMPTCSEPKLNIQVNEENLSHLDGGTENHSGINNENLLEDLGRIKTQIHAAPESVDLRLDLLRKLVQLDDQEGFKKAVDELTPLLNESHQTVWSDIRSMYFGKWAYDA